VVHEFGHFFAARKMGVKVEQFSLGFGKKILSHKRKDTEYSICVAPLGGYVKLAGDNLEEYKGNSDEYLAKPPGKRFWIIFSGPLLNYILGLLCFWLVFFCGYPAFTTKVGNLIDGFGAKDAGVRIGDKVTAIDGEKVEYWEDLQRIIQTKKINSLVRISILRDTQEQVLNVKLQGKDVDDPLAGKKRNIALLGIAPVADTVIVKHGPVQSLVLSFKRTWGLTVITYRGLWMMITARMSIKEATGPLGIFFLTSKVAQHGIIAVINLIGLISISLAIFNLLPLPVLDGGHIFLLAIEKIRGKYITLKTERAINNTGFSLIMMLAVVVTYNDIVRLFGDKIYKLFVK